MFSLRQLLALRARRKTKSISGDKNKDSSENKKGTRRDKRKDQNQEEARDKDKAGHEASIFQKSL